MFIEVYNIPLDMWNAPDEELKIEENKRLLSVEGLNVRHSSKSKGRAELRYRLDSTVITVLGSYEDIVERIINLGETSHIMKRLGE